MKTVVFTVALFLSANIFSIESKKKVSDFPVMENVLKTLSLLEVEEYPSLLQFQYTQNFWYAGDFLYCNELPSEAVAKELVSLIDYVVELEAKKEAFTSELKDFFSGQRYIWKCRETRSEYYSWVEEKMFISDDFKSIRLKIIQAWDE